MLYQLRQPLGVNVVSSVTHDPTKKKRKSSKNPMLSEGERQYDISADASERSKIPQEKISGVLVVTYDTL